MLNICIYPNVSTTYGHGGEEVVVVVVDFHISIMNLIDTLHTSFSVQPRFYAKWENLIIRHRPGEYSLCV